jgi:hypothetical protein
MPHASTGEKTGSHVDRLIRHVAGNYCSVRLSGVCSSRSKQSSSSVCADSTCRVVWRYLHYSLSVRHPSISLAFPTYIITSALRFNMVFAVHIAATPPSHYYWPCRSQPLPSHHSSHTSLPANMSCIAAMRQCPITVVHTSDRVSLLREGQPIRSRLFTTRPCIVVLTASLPWPSAVSHYNHINLERYPFNSTVRQHRIPGSSSSSTLAPSPAPCQCNHIYS